MPIPAPPGPGAFAQGETVTRRRAAPVTDPYSGEGIGKDWDAATEAVFTGCAVWQENSAEPLEVGRAAVITVTKVAFPAGADVVAGDRLVIRAEEYDVLGDPFDWQSPFTGWRPGKVAAARKVDG